ncbi:MAG: ATP synthase F1 subunit gamma [Candidatus Rifleibacteriota bacterium]
MTALKDIKQKIRGVSTTQQITRAMKMMSTARLGRAMEQINLTHSYIAKLEQIVQSLQGQLPAKYKHPCLTPRPVKNAGFIIIGGERGLCGGFNLELNRFAATFIGEHPAPGKKLVVIGKKAVKFFQKQPFTLLECYPDLTVRNAGEELFEVSDYLFSLFRDAEVDEINLIYTSFVSPTRKYLASPRLLPLSPVDIEARHTETRKQARPFDFTPSPTIIFDELIPRYLRNLLHRAIIESSASEQSARMAAMTSATDRAQEIIDELHLDFNRNRQALITREIAEVISGAEA